MASPRFSKVAKQLEENLKNLGYSKAKAKVVSLDSEGNVIAWLNLSSAGSAAGDLQCFLRFKSWEVAGLQFPDSMKTQLHAAGQFAEGAALVELIMEAPAGVAAAGGLHKFLPDVIHVLRGQNGAVVKLKETNAGSAPALAPGGVLATAAATWDAEGVEVGVLMPYGRGTAPGSLA